MIDIEAEIFTSLAKALRAAFSGINVTGEYVQAPKSFPHVSILEADNTAYTRSQDTSLSEHHARVMYEINIYSNKTTGKKSETKAIHAVIDASMQGMGFTRTYCSQVPNMLDAAIYRIVARYQAVVSTNKTIYRG